MSLSHLIRPDHCLDTVLELTPERLAGWGIRALIMDADNTLVPRNAYHLDTATRAWLEALIADGVRLCVLSNSAQPRKVARMVAELGIPTLALARKPARAGFRRALAAMAVEAGETAMVGDQLFTDIVGGNRMGMRTVLVRPCSTNDFIVYRLLGRPLERPLLRRRWAERRDD
ncbi:MAG: YqeG family HAD IIIA-type phosphatase [Armatimonadetes bacterium]|nr:YqeG family HAD IIIA-type phosphatase [Armatimonadota bacterium]